MTIEELKDFALKTQAYTSTPDLISFGFGNYAEVHMTPEGFHKLFTEYEVADRKDDKYPYKLYTEVDGVAFYCLTKER